LTVFEKLFPILSSAACALALGMVPLPLAAAALPPEPPGLPTATAGLSLLDAVQLMLRNDPNIGIVRTQVQASQGALLVASGQFDPLLTESLTQATTPTPLTATTSQVTNTTENDFGFSQQFRTGLSITPQLQLLRTDPTQPPFGANTAAVAFTFRQPLLRGRGRSATAAVELSATHEVAASRLDLAHATTERIVAVVGQYWTLKAAEENLAILRESERSARELLDNTRKLVAADQTPAAELIQLEANLAAEEVARLGGETSLFKARQDLGREIGLDSAAIAALPLPAEPFPAVRSEEIPPPAAADRFVTEALDRRADLKAARERLAEGDILVVSATNALEPQLDLILTPGYLSQVAGGGVRNYFSPLYRSIPGGSLALGFALSLPLLHDKERGALEQTLAGRQADALRVELTAKEIGADVPTALDAVGRSALQLEKSNDAVRLFERTVINEEKKLRAGSSTLINVLTQRDRLTAARQAQVSAELTLALALVQLRFATGTLLSTDGEVPAVRLSRLTTLPSPTEATP
jgi:outer membrane protein TolC